MQDVSVSYAKEHLEELVLRAARGEDVRIVVPDIGTAKLYVLPNAGSVVERKPGRWAGRFTVPARLFEPLNDDELGWLSGEQSP